MKTYYVTEEVVYKVKAKNKNDAIYVRHNQRSNIDKNEDIIYLEFKKVQIRNSKAYNIKENKKN